MPLLVLDAWTSAWRVIEGNERAFWLVVAAFALFACWHYRYELLAISDDDLAHDHSRDHRSIRQHARARDALERITTDKGTP